MGSRVQSWDSFKKQKRGNTRLQEWKENGSVVVYIHTKNGVTPRLFHLVPYVGEDDKGKNVIKYLPFVCHEEVRDFFSKNPVKHCPICKSIEWLSENSKIKDNEIVWEAGIGNQKQDRISTKIDYIGDGDWRQTFKPRVQYVLVVVDPENVDNGLLIDVEPQLVGDQLMKTVGEQIEKLEEAGDPAINPYPFKFKYHNKAKTPKETYSVLAWDGKLTMTPEIYALLNSDAIDLSNYLAPTKTSELREVMETHFKPKVDLDIFFDSTLTESADEADFDTKKLEAESAEEKIKAGKDEDPEESTKESVSDDEDSSDDRIACETCGGTGKVGKKGMPCPDCDGTGYVEPEASEELSNDEPPAEVDCETCGGTGKVGKKGSPCPDCGGTGTVPVESEPVEPKVEPTVEPKVEPKEEPKTRTVKPKEPKAEEPDFSGVDPKDMSQCGNCHKMIPDSANVCPFCHAEF